MPKNLANEPTFDQIINPEGHIWEDEWDEYYFSGMTANQTPQHARKEKPNMFAKSVQFLVRALVLTFMIVGILWLADVAGELATQLIPF